MPKCPECKKIITKIFIIESGTHTCYLNGGVLEHIGFETDGDIREYYCPICDCEFEFESDDEAMEFLRSDKKSKPK